MSLTPSGWQEALRLCAAGLKLPGITTADSAELLEVSAEAYDAGGQPSLAARMRERAAGARRRAHR